MTNRRDSTKPESATRIGEVTTLGEVTLDEVVGGTGDGTVVPSDEVARKLPGKRTPPSVTL